MRENRFWSHVDQSGGEDACWEWRGLRNEKGYGRFRFSEHVWYRAHRYAYKQHTGDAPGAMLVCHTCDNPPCCNPRHLFLGTAADNSADMMRKGRYRPHGQKGSQNKHAVLTESDIPEIRMLLSHGWNNTEIGERYGVSHATISAIRRGKTWWHVPSNNRANERFDLLE